MTWAALLLTELFVLNAVAKQSVGLEAFKTVTATYVCSANTSKGLMPIPPNSKFRTGFALAASTRRRVNCRRTAVAPVSRTYMR